MRMTFDRRRAGLIATAAGLMGAALSGPAFAAPSDEAVAMAQENWRAAIARIAAPSLGCFEAEYPSTTWKKVSCTEAPHIPYLPRSNAHAATGTQTVGDGHDYAAEVAGTMTGSVGSFPSVSGVTSEKDGSRSNVYSIQLNSNFMTTAACNGTSGCLAWEQFVYSSSEQSAFMQYWLIDYGKACPSGWNTFSTDCWKNSSAVRVPKIPISYLSKLKLSGNAVANGNDTLVFSIGNKAYSTSGKDSVTYLATDWNQSEFNIIGDGGGSAATFNSGSSIAVKVNVVDGTSNAPTCASDAGTTGETNNLNLGSCTTAGGSSPYMQFTESN